MSRISIFLIIFSLAASYTAAGKGKKPVACFSLSAQNIEIGDPVLINDCSTGAYRYIIDYGDGSVSGVTRTQGGVDKETHVYHSKGRFQIILTVFDSLERSFSTAKQYINVTSPQRAQTLVIDTIIFYSMPVEGNFRLCITANTAAESEQKQIPGYLTNIEPISLKPKILTIPLHLYLKQVYKGSSCNLTIGMDVREDNMCGLDADNYTVASFDVSSSGWKSFFYTDSHKDTSKSWSYAIKWHLE